MTRTVLAALADQLARLDLDTVAATALATRAAIIAAAVRDALSHLPGDSHEYPWLRTGALRDSIVAENDAAEAVVASTSDVALYQEHGTATVPPRPFLAPVAASGSSDAANAIGAAIGAAIADAVAGRSSVSADL